MKEFQRSDDSSEEDSKEETKVELVEQLPVNNELIPGMWLI
jgi:hypothetical protein